MANPLALQDVDNEVLRSADDYLRKHKILELFEVNLTAIFVNLFVIGPDHPCLLQEARQLR